MHARSNESYLKTELCLIVEASATTLDQTTFKSLWLGEMNVAHGLSVEFKVVKSATCPFCFAKFLYLGKYTSFYHRSLLRVNQRINTNCSERLVFVL